MKNLLWKDLNHMLYKTFFLKNIIKKIFIFQYVGCINSSKNIHEVFIHFFIISPFTISTNKITLCKYTILHLNFGRMSLLGKQIKFQSKNIDIDMDNFFLPKFSLLSQTPVNNKRYKIWKSLTYYPPVDTYFEYYNCILQKSMTYHSIAYSDSLKYFYLMSSFYYSQNCNVPKSNYLNNNIRHPVYFQNTYDMVNNFLYFYIKHEQPHIIKQTYSWPLKFIIIPFFFEIPFIFFLESIGYYDCGLEFYLPFMFYTWWLRYMYHKKGMTTWRINRRHHPYTNQRNDYCDVRYRAKYRPKDFKIVLGADKNGIPWTWGWVWTHYPYKGGKCVIW